MRKEDENKMPDEIDLDDPENMAKGLGINSHDSLDSDDKNIPNEKNLEKNDYEDEYSYYDEYGEYEEDEDNDEENGEDEDNDEENGENEDNDEKDEDDNEWEIEKNTSQKNTKVKSSDKKDISTDFKQNNKGKSVKPKQKSKQEYSQPIKKGISMSSIIKSIIFAGIFIILIFGGVYFIGGKFLSNPAPPEVNNTDSVNRKGYPPDNFETNSQQDNEVAVEDFEEDEGFSNFDEQNNSQENLNGSGYESQGNANKQNEDIIDNIDTEELTTIISETVSSELETIKMSLQQDIDKLSDKIVYSEENTSEINQEVNTPKTKDVQAELNELIEKNKELIKQNKDFEGKNVYLRNLEREHRYAKEACESELREIKNGNLSSNNNILNYPEWQIIGMSDDLFVVKNIKTDETQTIKVGESFMGVKIKKIDIVNKTLKSDKGIVKFAE